MKCSIDGCEKPTKARGLCDKHYYRLRKHGDPNVTMRVFTSGLVHGTVDGYKHHKCRCDACRGAKRASDAAYRQAHPDVVRAASKRQRERDPDYMARKRREWKMRNPEKVREYGQARAMAPFDAYAIAYADILRRDPCVYCGGRMEQIDHVRPISQGGDSDWMNLAPACARCNGTKGARSLLRFLADSLSPAL